MMLRSWVPLHDKWNYLLFWKAAGPTQGWILKLCILGNLSGGESSTLCVRDLYVTLDE